MRKVDFHLYLITDRTQVIHEDLLTAVQQALDGGVKSVQMREKDWSDRQVFKMGSALRTLTRDYGAKLFINDRADLTVAVEADGVHLTQSSYSAKEARKIVGESCLIGVSTHSVDEARQAQEQGADFVTLGPVFETPAKMRYGPPVGLGILRDVLRTVQIPVLAIGGIKRENLSSVLACGACGVALISGILATPDIKVAASKIDSLIQDNPCTVKNAQSGVGKGKI